MQQAGTRGHQCSRQAPVRAWPVLWAAMAASAKRPVRPVLRREWRRWRLPAVASAQASPPQRGARPLRRPLSRAQKPASTRSRATRDAERLLWSRMPVPLGDASLGFCWPHSAECALCRISSQGAAAKEGAATACSRKRRRRQRQQQQQQQQQSNAVLSEADFKLLQERLQAKRKRGEVGHAEGHA